MEVRLAWAGSERFVGKVDGTPVTLDGDTEVIDDLSPMQAVAAGLAGCMAIDIASILEKGRQPLERLDLRLSAERAEDPPRRFVSFRLQVVTEGEIEASRVERAIELSKEKYCSVWHSLRQDIPFEVEWRRAGGDL